MDVNHELSRLVAKRMRAKKKTCWANACAALWTLPELAGAVYVEGWMLTDGDRIAGEHGWLELDGEIIDPTWPDGMAGYYPGLRFTRDELGAELARSLELPLVWRRGWGGGDSPEYRAAWEAAYAASAAWCAEQNAQREAAGHGAGEPVQ